jgi:hypothetical protein
MTVKRGHLLEDDPSQEFILRKGGTAQNVRNPDTNRPIGSYRLDDVAVAEFPNEPEPSSE